MRRAYPRTICVTVRDETFVLAGGSTANVAEKIFYMHIHMNMIYVIIFLHVYTYTHTYYTHMHAYIATYIHAFIHSYIHAYMHIYIYEQYPNTQIPQLKDLVQPSR